MPYPAKKQRDTIDRSPVGDCVFTEHNELTYATIRLALQFAKDDHAKLQEAIGAIESAKQELYRKYITPAAAQHEFEHGGFDG